MKQKEIIPVANERRQQQQQRQRQYEKNPVAKSGCCNQSVVGEQIRQRSQVQRRRQESCCNCCCSSLDIQDIGKSVTCNESTNYSHLSQSKETLSSRKIDNMSKQNQDSRMVIRNKTKFVIGNLEKSKTQQIAPRSLINKCNSSPVIKEEDDLANCAKCQLIAQWTLAQAARIETEGSKIQRRCIGNRSKLEANVNSSRNKLDRDQSRPSINNQSLIHKSSTKLSELIDKTSESILSKTQRLDEDTGEISSLTESCFSSNPVQDPNEDDDYNTGTDKWSLISSSGNQIDDRINIKNADSSSLPSYKMQTRALNVKPRRQAPRPPPLVSENNNNIRRAQCDSSKSSSNSGDSGHASGTSETSGLVKGNLLSELEITSIEHFLKSHKSATYVCGCMANLYLTNTRLADNGRRSMPTSWQLSRTGVPVLTFDSGLAKNRDKRRLSINLTERGSGFVLWSDIIDHLSNYRAYSSRLHSTTDDSTSSCSEIDPTTTTTCDTFHVMYLSSNHRVMVGLSFDDAQCARLFLRQVELVSSDPTNIALTGPKLAQRLASASRIVRLFSTKNGNSTELKQAEAKARAAKQRTRSIGSLENDAALMENTGGLWSSSGCLTTASNSLIQKRKQSRLAQLITQQATNQSWSTLKRAIRLTGSRQTTRYPLKLGEFEVEEESNVAKVLRPKPLASLASAGRTYKVAKRLPRKCDISAPCLFQHVTRVDINGLEQLYSRALVVKSTAYNGQQELTRTGSPDSIQKQPETPQTISQVSSGSANKDSSRSISQQASISASSCYSSASSNSPASSEYEAANVVQQSSANRLRSRPLDLRLQRLKPTPPKVPQRTISVTQSSYHHQQSSEVPTMQQCNDNKIQAIIRELQTQTSLELVDAKRKLMADIADQVLARNQRSVSHL